MKKEMHIITRSRILVSVAVVAIATFALWAWQGIQSTISKGLSDSKSVRIGKANTCEASTGAQEPHFSGCNSIL